MNELKNRRVKASSPNRRIEVGVRKWQKDSPGIR